MQNQQNSGGVHHKDGDFAERQFKRHKQWVEKDFPIAVTKFKIARLKQDLAFEKILSSLENYSKRLEKNIENLK